MKIFFKIIILNFLINSNLFGQSDSLQFFYGEFKDALSIAKKTNKPLFIEFGADWCAPCVKMKHETFTDPKIIRLINDTFIAVKIDVDQFVGMDIAERYKIKEYPTYLFLDKNGSYFASSKGFFPPNYFLLELSKNNPENKILTKSNKSHSKKKS